MKRVLMIAFEFPPCHSSGVQRTYKFAEYLCGLGWEPIVLCASERLYQNIESDFEIADCLKGKVFRVDSLNLKKLFSIRNRYPSVIEFFDKNWPWYCKAYPKGIELIEQFKPQIIWSTYPVITAHLVAYKLSKKTGLPWIMDYRDPLRQHYDLEYKNANKLVLYLERKMIEQCSSVVFTTNRTLGLYEKKYELQSYKFNKISNGYSNLFDFEQGLNSTGEFTFVHSGVLYDGERDITPLVIAVSNISKKVAIEKRFVFRFRGAQISGEILKLINELKVSDYFQFLPPVTYKNSIEEMAEAKAFLLVQGDKFSNQVPGKIYEYCQFKKPILALCSNNSATYEEFKDLKNIHFSISASEIENTIISIIQKNEIYDYEVSKYSRFEKAKELKYLIENLNVESRS